jgi:hypothetical protein
VRKGREENRENVDEDRIGAGIITRNHSKNEARGKRHTKSA